MTDGGGISVSELNLIVAEAIRRDYRTRSVTVRGEVSGFKNHLATGHWYFSLKDPDSAVSCVMFRTNTFKAALRPKDGDLVLADGYVDVYPAQGKYQLYVTGLRSAGTGDLFVRLEALKKKLAAEGLFDPGRKRPLPLLPRKVAVVTSESGAALHDILNVSAQRSPSIPIVLVPAAVQGIGAGKEIAAAIRRASRETDADVIIVARGGGSAEDLWCFNEEEVARAVAESRLPVVSGVGHEVDINLCDLAADVRASTPSNAAEIVFPDRRELRGRIGLIRSELCKAHSARIRTEELRTAEIRRRLTAISPEKRIALLMSRTEMCREKLLSGTRILLDRKGQECAAARTALEYGMSRRMTEAEQRVVRLREKMKAVSPLAILGRGYALVYSAEGHLLTRASQAAAEKDMTLQFSDGRVQVMGKDRSDGGESDRRNSDL